MARAGPRWVWDAAVGPLTALPRALTPAERGQGLCDGFGWCSNWQVGADPRARFIVPSQSTKPLPPLRGGEGARQRGEGADGGVPSPLDERSRTTG